MAKQGPAQGAGLSKAQAINAAVAELRRSNPGMTVEQARNSLGLPPKNGTALVPYQSQPQPHVVYVPTRQPRARAQRAPRETIVPTRDGTDVTSRSGVALKAKIDGHVKIEFDQRTIGAMLTGFIYYMRHGEAVDLEAVFPELATEKSEKQATIRRELAQERRIGEEQAKLLGVAAKAYGVTEEEWVAWFRAACSKAAVMAPHAAQPAQPHPPTNGDAEGFGSPLGAPTTVTDGFGTPR